MLRVDIQLTQPGLPDPMYPSVLCLVTQSCLTFCDPMDCSAPGSSVHGDSPGKNTRVGCCALIQGIFSTQGLNPSLSHWKQILYHLSHQGKSRILEWIVYPFSWGSSQIRNWTRSLLHCRQILYQLSYQGSPMYPFSLFQCNPSAQRHPFVNVPSQQIRIQRGTSRVAPVSSLFPMANQPQCLATHSSIRYINTFNHIQIKFCREASHSVPFRWLCTFLYHNWFFSLISADHLMPSILKCSGITPIDL